MDTIKNVVSSASNAIFGNSTENSGNEPVSGKMGAGTVNEPYDQGNKDGGGGSPLVARQNDSSAPQDETSTTSNTTSINPINATRNKMSSQTITGDPSSGQQPFQKQEGADRPNEAPTNPAENQAVKETKQEAESVQQAGNKGGSDQQQQDSSVSDENQAVKETNQESETAQQAGANGDSNQQRQDFSASDENQATKETKQEAETTQQDDTNGGNDQQQQDSAASNERTKSTTSDVKHPQTEDERQEMAMKGELPKIPGDRSGEPLKMHNRDDTGEDPSDQSEEGENKPDRSASVGQEGGGEHGKEKGTGTKYVKSTGLAAEGGDFDATKPGAGREANRLMEEKGMHTSKVSGNEPNVGKPSSEPSKMEKLKDKLHIGTGKHGNEQRV